MAETISRAWSALALGVLTWTHVLGAQGSTPKPEPVSLSTASLTGLDRARRATVSLDVTGVSGHSSGSGVVVLGAGVVATAAHVIHGASEVRVRLPNGEIYDAVGVLDYDERLDIALVAVAGFELQMAELGN